MELSNNAQKLLTFLKKSGAAWHQNCIKALFPEPKYESNPEAQTAYWQWEVNLYGNELIRPVGQENIKFIPVDNYSQKTSEAYQELKKAGLADEKNNGYNEYMLYAK
jgi:hypothetical protein